MYGVLLIFLRLCRILKLLCFHSMGVQMKLSTSRNQILCVKLSLFFCSMTSEILNFREYPHSNKANPCHYFMKSFFNFFSSFFSIVITVELIHAEMIKTSCFKKKTIIFTNIPHLPSCNCLIFTCLFPS